MWRSAPAIAVVLALSVPARAADTWAERVLAATFVCEAGWRSVRDWRAMAHVLSRRAHRPHDMSLVSAALAYSSCWTSDAPEWPRALAQSRRRPPWGWPDNLSWTVHLPAWLNAVTYAQQALRGELGPDPCLGKADYFGGAMDSRHAERVGCGDTVKVYWRVRR